MEGRSRYDFYSPQFCNSLNFWIKLPWMRNFVVKEIFRGFEVVILEVDVLIFFVR